MSTELASLRSRSEAWSQPIPGANPGGLPARSAPEFDDLAGEMSKLESPSGGAVNWEKVVETAGAILQHRSKDLLVACQFAAAQLATAGLDGLLTGTVLVWDLVEGSWAVIHPDLKRLRGRAAALGWFVTRAAQGLTTIEVTARDRAVVLALNVAMRGLAVSARQKLDAMAPGFGAVFDEIEKLKHSLPEDAPPPPPPPPPVVEEPVAEARSEHGSLNGSSNGESASAHEALRAPEPTEARTWAREASAGRAPAPAAAPGRGGPAGVLWPLEGPDDVSDFLLRIGSALGEGATTLRAADEASPLAAHLARAAAWLRFAELPAEDGLGRTRIPSLPGALRSELDEARGQQSWGRVIELVEGALPQHPLALDLQRYALEAFEARGHEGALRVARGALAGLLRRFPELPFMSGVDGNPFADFETRAILESEPFAPAAAPAPSGASGPSAHSVAEPPPAPIAEAPAINPAIAEAEELGRNGDVAGAVSRLEAALASAPDGRERFRLRLAMADLCRAGSRLPVARALYQILDQEATARGLEDWDRALASSFLTGYIQCLRQPDDADQEASRRVVAGLYQRLCRVDSSAALRLES